MERKERLKKIFDTVESDKREVIAPLLDEVIFIEGRLAALRKQPMIRIHPKDASRQQITAAGKQYKEFMQAYLNAIKVLEMTLYRAGEDGESPLVKALQKFVNENE